MPPRSTWTSTRCAAVAWALAAGGACRVDPGAPPPDTASAPPAAAPAPSPREAPPAPAAPDGPVLVTAAVPSRGPAAGGTEVRVDGRGFMPDTRVYFGEVAADEVRVLGDGRLMAVAPPAPGVDAVMTVPLWVENRAGTGRLDGAWTWAAALAVEAVEPDRAPEDGGAWITVRGGGFTPDARVRYGGRPAEAVEVESARRLRFLSPVCYPGPQSVEVFAGDAHTRLREAVRCYEPVALHGVVPDHGPPSGGNTVVLAGAGLEPDARVWFGDAEATVPPQAAARDRLEVVVPEAARRGVIDVRVAAVGEEVVLGGAYAYDDPVEILDVSPVRLAAGGGTAVAVKGRGFSGDMLLTIGGRPVVMTHRVEAPDGAEDLVAGIAPPGLAGAANVRISSRFGDAEWPDVVLYEAAPELRSVVPAVADLRGGETVVLLGEALSGAAQVRVGGAPAAVLGRQGADGLRVRVPRAASGAPGPADVEVEQRSGRTRLAGGLVYVSTAGADAALAGVAPATVPTRGGVVVTVAGRGLARATWARFGRADGIACQLGSQRAVTCEAPPRGAGLVDVEVDVGGRTLRLPGALHYVDALTVDVAEPSRPAAYAPATVTLHGAGFAGTLSARAAGFDVPVRVLDEATLEIDVPASPPGPVDAEVRRDDGAVATLREAFAFVEPLAITAVDPPAGARAGGTLVVVRGAGFAPGARVTLGGEDVRAELRDARTLVLRTPPGVPGAAVFAVDRGDARAEATFVYVDPMVRRGGTAGGPINRHVDVTVRDTLTGLRLPGATVVVEHAGGSLTGTTDLEGQVTLSELGLRGPVQVTAAHPDFTRATFARFDAAHVTFHLVPLFIPPAGPPPPNPDAPARPIVRGVVRGLDPKLLPLPRPGSDEEIAIYVRATTVGRYSRNPEPGPLADLRAEGHYALRTREGDQALYAVAGLRRRTTGAFTPYLMGLRHFVFLNPGEVKENQDIYLNVPVDRTLAVSFEEAPGGSADPRGPQRAIVDVALDLSPFGFAAEHVEVVSDGLERVATVGPLPRLEAGALAAVEATYTLRARAVVGSGFPLAVTWVERVRDATEPVVVTPWVDLAWPREPAEGATQVGPRRFAFDVRCCAEASYTRVRFTDSWGKGLWDVVVPGSERGFVLPDLGRLDAFPAGERARWSVTRVLTASPFDVDHFTYRDLGGRWVGYSLTQGSFTR